MFLLPFLLMVLDSLIQISRALRAKRIPKQAGLLSTQDSVYIEIFGMLISTQAKM